jgi:hypothetical protein
VGPFGNFPKLEANHKLAVVLTAIPGAPNGLSQLIRYQIKPGDVEGLVDGLKIDPALGPEWNIAVGPGVITARIAWQDEHEDVIERSFGFGVPDPGADPAAKAAADEQAAGDDEILKQLTVNRDDCEAIAKATAVQIWSMLRDRLIGQKTVRMTPGAKIAGNISEVTHQISESGAHSIIRLADELPRRNVFALLPDSVRKIILREVDPT